MRARIPKGFRPKAQGCEGRATLGNGPKEPNNPERVAAPPLAFETQQSSAATLSGLNRHHHCTPRVARPSQPWAGGRNPFGIGNVSKVQRGLPHSKTLRAIRRPFGHLAAREEVHAWQIANLRYSRLKICATLPARSLGDRVQPHANKFTTAEFVPPHGWTQLTVGESAPAGNGELAPIAERGR